MYNFYLNHATIACRKLFVAFTGAVLWNSLCPDLKERKSLPLFKSRIC
jgi:hypothetical protein